MLSASTATTARIDAGGPAYTDSAGIQWLADTDYSGGSVTNTPYAVANTADPALIYSRRWGNFSYSIPLANGTYSLSLYFAEPRDTGPNQRIFDVSAQGNAILTNFDIYAAAGYQTEITETFTVYVTNNVLNLTWTSVKDVACVSAIAAVQTATSGPALPTSTYINAGGGTYVDSSGTTWAADEDYSGGSVTNTPYTVANTSDPALIYSRRWGNFSYNIPLADGTYTLELYFAEPRDTGPGQRLFDVDAQGAAILTNFDIYATAGYQTAVVESFTVAVGNGSLNIVFTTVKDTACVSAIAVAPVGALTPPTDPTPPSAPTPVSSPWIDSDIGAVGDAGSATQTGSSNAIITVSGGGADIWGDDDAFNFAYQPLVGNGSITAQITSEQDTSDWAKAGVMIRESTNDDSRYVMLALTPGYGVTFQVRSATHNTTTHATTAAAVGDWLKLTRIGSTFTAYLSTDGSTWSQVGVATIPMINNVYAGLCVTAHNNADLNTSTFDDVSVTTTGTTASDWSNVATEPVAEWESESVTYNGKLYIFGGFTDRSLDETAECYVFDPTSDTWSFLTDIPTGSLAHAGTTLVGDTVYLAGGDIGRFTYGKNMTATSQVLTYNLDTNTWGSISSLPVAVSCGGLVAINNELYYYGGINSTDTTDVGNTYAFDLNNPSAGWVTRATMPNPRNHLGYVAINGIAYAVGGEHLYTQYAGNVAEVDAYNPATNTWSQVAALPQPWGSIEVSTIAVDGKIMVVGGQTNGGTDGIYQNLIEVFDPSTNQWSNVGTIPEANEGLTTAYISGQLFVIGGTVDNQGGWPQDETWMNSLLDV